MGGPRAREARLRSFVPSLLHLLSFSHPALHPALADEWRRRDARRRRLGLDTTSTLAPCQGAAREDTALPPAHAATAHVVHPELLGAPAPPPRQLPSGEVNEAWLRQCGPAELRVAYRDIEAARRGALQSLRAARQAEASARAELPGLRSLVQALQAQVARRGGVGGAA